MNTCIGLHEFKMKKHIYIHFPAWRKWNAAEFAALFVNIADTASAMGADTLKCDASRITALEAMKTQLTEIVAQSKASALTKKITEKDDQLDALVASLMASVKAMTTVPVASLMDAAQELSAVLSPYKSVHRLSYVEQIQMIDGMLVDIEKHDAAVKTLGLSNVVEQITVTKAELGILLEQRKAEAIESDLGQIEPLRKEAVTLLEAMLSEVYAHHVLEASEESAQFFKFVDATLTNAENALAVRTAERSKKKEEEGETLND